jgi:hypothetical protein
MMTLLVALPLPDLVPFPTQIRHILTCLYMIATVGKARGGRRAETPVLHRVYQTTSMLLVISSTPLELV